MPHLFAYITNIFQKKKKKTTSDNVFETGCNYYRFLTHTQEMSTLVSFKAVFRSIHCPRNVSCIPVGHTSLRLFNDAASENKWLNVTFAFLTKSRLWIYGEKEWESRHNMQNNARNDSNRNLPLCLHPSRWGSMTVPGKGRKRQTVRLSW